MHDILHWLGIDTQQSYFYDFWSGVGTQVKITWIAILYIVWRRNNCIVPRCWRITRQVTNGGHHVCHKHHPDGKPTHLQVVKAHKEMR
jgi:hypothetical protein